MIIELHTPAGHGPPPEGLYRHFQNGPHCSTSERDGRFVMVRWGTVKMWAGCPPQINRLPPFQGVSITKFADSVTLCADLRPPCRRSGPGRVFSKNQSPVCTRG